MYNFNEVWLVPEEYHGFTHSLKYFASGPVTDLRPHYYISRHFGSEANSKDRSRKKRSHSPCYQESITISCHVFNRSFVYESYSRVDAFIYNILHFTG